MMKFRVIWLIFIAAAPLILQTSCTSLNTEAECLKSGKAHYEKEQYDQAVRDYTRAIELKPDSAEAYKERGNTYSQLKQNDKAIQDYSKAIEINPAAAETYLNRAWGYLCLDQYDNAFKDYAKSKELTQDDTELNYKRLVDYNHLKKYEKKIQDYSKAIEFAPDNPEPYRDRARIYSLFLKQYDKAIRDYSKAIELRPDKTAYCNRGYAYRMSDRYPEAIQDYSKAIELAPDNAVPYRERAQIYSLCLRQYDKAIKDFSKYIELRPDDEAYSNRGYAYRMSDRYPEAIQDYSKAIELESHLAGIDKPDNSGKLSSLVMNYINRGYLYGHMGQYDKAIQDYSEAIKLSPENFYSYFLRATMYAASKQYDKSIKDYSLFIAHVSDDADAYLGILEIYIITGKPVNFNKLLKQFEAIIPESKLSEQNLLIKLYLVCLYKCILNEPRTDIEKHMDALLKEKIELSWSFELTDEWLDNPKNGLMPEQIKYIRELSDKVKASQKK